MTYLFPGPAILSTWGTRSVPYAREPMAQGPPILNRRWAPARCAATRVAGFTAISWPGRGAGDNFFNPGDLGGDDVHEGARGVARQAAGDVAAHPGDGPHQPPRQDAGADFHGPHLPLPLGLVEGLDVGGGGLQGFQDPGVEALVGGVDLGGAYLQPAGGQIGLVLAVPTQALPGEEALGIPAPAQSRKDGPHVLQDLADVFPGTVQQVVEPVGGQVFQVLHLQDCHHEPPLVRKMYCIRAIIYDCSI